MEFGITLARQRRLRRLSQSDLAGLSGVSQRHISFLESGRSAPGRTSIAKLVEALSLSKAEAQHLLATAGLGSLQPQLSWSSPELSDVRQAASLLIAQHEPFPALVCDCSGDVLGFNIAFQRIIEFADEGGKLLSQRHNLYDLTLHPDGLFRLMGNPDEIVPHTLHRLKTAAAFHEGARKTLTRTMSYPCAAAYGFSSPSASTGVLTEHYRVGDQDLRIISLTSSFGCPEDEIAQNIRFELFLPADAGTANFFRQIATLE